MPDPTDKREDLGYIAHEQFCACCGVTAKQAAVLWQAASQHERDSWCSVGRRIVEFERG